MIPADAGKVGRSKADLDSGDELARNCYGGRQTLVARVEVECALCAGVHYANPERL